jgi:streptomycin 3"-adenylyltransferase
MSHYGWATCPQAVKEQVQGFVREIDRLLVDNLIGVYLHGSLAMGCFHPQHSDLDLLVITQQALSLTTKRQLAELLLAQSAAPRPIEISVVVHGDLLPWRYPTPYDFHYSETWREKVGRELHDGGWHIWNTQLRHDPDLAAHVTITKHRGICLQGAPIEQVFPDVPAADYLASILGDVQDALALPVRDPVYAILNACRVYAFVREGRVMSKQEGGLWALAVVPAPLHPTILAALESYTSGQSAAMVEPAAVAAFASYMSAQLALPAPLQRAQEGA